MNPYPIPFFPFIKARVIYIFVTIIAFMFVIAFVWFTLWAIITPVATATTTIANNFHNESWALYDTLNFAESFMTNFWQYLLVFAMMGLTLWVWIYSQPRGQPYT